jgi:hypothetical protein
MVPQAPAVHVAVAFAGVAHGVQFVPHDIGDALLTHVPPQSWKPVAHIVPHAPDTHVATVPGGAGQGVQFVPQLAIDVDETHVEPHAWNPELHESPQLVPSHVAVPFGSVGHGVQLVPHPLVESFATHAPLHMWLLALQFHEHVPLVHDAVAPEGAGHTVPQEPQFCGSVAVSEQAPDGQCIIPAGHPVAHPYAPVVMSRRHTGVAPLHIVPQAPQFIESVSDVSHPFDATPSQSPRSARQPVIAQAPIAHCTIAGSTPSRAVQSFSHDPQRCGESIATHVPLQRIMPAGQPESTSARASPSGKTIASPSMTAMSTAASCRAECGSAQAVARVASRPTFRASA